MLIDQYQFSGAKYRPAEHLVGLGLAQVAVNTKVNRGMIEAWKAPSQVAAVPSSKTIYPYQGGWLAWTTDVSVVPIGDAAATVIWTDGTQPKLTNAAKMGSLSGTYNQDPQVAGGKCIYLGLPMPTVQPAGTPQGSAPAVPNETKTYAYAWVYNTGAPAVIGSISADITLAFDSTTYTGQLTGLATTPPATVNGKPATASKFTKNIYYHDSANGQYVLLEGGRPASEDSWTDKGQYNGAIQKTFSSGIAAPTGGTAAAVPLTASLQGSRTYVYCWTWQNATGTWFKSPPSAGATISAPEGGNGVWVGGGASPFLTSPTVTPPIPSGSKNISKRLFRTDRNGTYKQVAVLGLSDTVYLDTVLSANLGQAMSHFTTYGSGNPLAPTVVLNADNTQNLQTESVSYIYTWVDAYGRESEPSLPSPVIDRLPYQYVTVNLPGAAPTGYTWITTQRVYRTDQSGAWRWVVDLPIAATSWDDSIPDTDLQGIMATQGWAPPPNDMHNIVALPGGIIAGLSGNNIVFSVPGAPYAYPLAYQLTMDYAGVAMAVTSMGLLVATTGTPYLVLGNDPASMQLTKLDVKQACVSGPSMVDMGDYALYASPDGIVAAQGAEVKVMSWESITRDQWQAFSPATMRAYFYEGRYLVFNNAGKGWVFDPADQTFVEIDLAVTAGFLDLSADILYLQIGGNIQQWDGGLALTYRWRSARELTARLANAACALVQADAYPITFNLYADGTQVFSGSVANNAPFALPGGYLANAFEVEVQGTAAVRRVRVAESWEELTRANG